MKLLERQLCVVLDPTDRSLIHFFLFLFFLAYLAIISPTIPRDILHSRRREFETSDSNHPKEEDSTPSSS